MLYTAMDVFINIMTNWSNWVVIGLVILMYLVFLLLYWIYLHYQWRQNVKKEIIETMEERLKTLVEPSPETYEHINIVNGHIVEMVSDPLMERILFMHLDKDKNTILAKSWSNYNSQKEYNVFYVDCENLEHNMHHDYGSLLVGRLVMLANYKMYLRKQMRMKLLNIFASKLPFNMASDISSLEVNKKTIIYLDNVDKCKAANVKVTLDIIKDSFCNIDNLIIVCPLSKQNIIKILNHYYAYTYLMTPAELTQEKVFEHYAKTINSRVIEF